MEQSRRVVERKTERGKTMNREILFRGKRIDNGEWVYGYFTYNCVDHLHIARIERSTGNEYGEPVDYITVDETTVGQFTGLTDKNDNKIFEGDIITLYDENNEPIGNYFIEFYKGAYCYAQYVCGKKYYSRINAEQRDEDGEIFATYIFEVVGNIYDNPELLTNKT